MSVVRPSRGDEMSSYLTPYSRPSLRLIQEVRRMRSKRTRRCARAAQSLRGSPPMHAGRWQGARARPPFQLRHSPPFFSQRLAIRSCLRASPSAAVPHEGATWCDLASEDGDSLGEKILFLAVGNVAASALLTGLATVASVPQAFLTRQERHSQIF